MVYNPHGGRKCTQSYKIGETIERKE